MKKTFLNFLLGETLLTVGIFLVGLILYKTVMSFIFLPILPWLIGIFFIVTLGFHYLQLYFLYYKVKNFNHVFLAGFTAKLLIYLTFFTVYIFHNRENVMVFTLIFLSLYVSYTFFEIFSLLKVIKKLKQG